MLKKASKPLKLFFVWFIIKQKKTVNYLDTQRKGSIKKATPTLLLFAFISTRRVAFLLLGHRGRNCLLYTRKKRQGMKPLILCFKKSKKNDNATTKNESKEKVKRKSRESKNNSLRRYFITFLLKIESI